jgi:hypothetical protein
MTMITNRVLKNAGGVYAEFGTIYHDKRMAAMLNGPTRLIPGSPIYLAAVRAAERLEARQQGPAALEATLRKQAAQPRPDTADAMMRKAGSQDPRHFGRPVCAPSGVDAAPHPMGDNPVRFNAGEEGRAGIWNKVVAGEEARIANGGREGFSPMLAPTELPPEQVDQFTKSGDLRTLQALAVLEARRRAAKRGRSEPTFGDLEDAASKIMRKAVQADNPVAVKGAERVAKSRVGEVRKAARAAATSSEWRRGRFGKSANSGVCPQHGVDHASEMNNW